LALHLKVGVRKRKAVLWKEEKLKNILEKALSEGPNSLTNKEKKAILNDGKSLVSLHWAVWKLDDKKAKFWGINKF
jgi:membrane glycosyltransferase